MSGYTLANISASQGYAKSISITVTQGGSALDLRGGTAMFQLSKTLDAPPVYAYTGNVAASGISGVAYFNLTTAQTTGYELNRYEYEMYWQSGLTRHELAKGDFVIEERFFWR